MSDRFDEHMTPVIKVIIAESTAKLLEAHKNSDRELVNRLTKDFERRIDELKAAYIEENMKALFN